MTTNRYQVLRDVNDRQRLAIEALVTGATHTEAAEKAGVHRVTVSNWVNKHPGFQAELNRRRDELNEQRTARLRELDTAALEAVATRLEAEDSEFAMKWLKFRGLNATTFPNAGPTDPEDIIKVLVSARANQFLDARFYTLRSRGIEPNDIRNEVEDELLSEFGADGS
jgi:hypothetical protein